MERYYPAVISKERETYGIDFPDFPGCVSLADTPEGVIEGGQEALGGHVALMVKDGDAIPNPTPIEDISWEPGEGVLWVAMIPVVIPDKAKRINITINESLLAEIDKASGNRSKFIAEAARDALERRHA